MSMAGGRLPAVFKRLLQFTGISVAIAVAVKPLTSSLPPPVGPHAKAKLARGGGWDAALLEPLNAGLRGEILRYGDLAQATYDAFDNRYWSRNCGTCLHGLRRMLPALGLAGHGYVATRRARARGGRLPTSPSGRHRPCSRKRREAASIWLSPAMLAREEGGHLHLATLGCVHTEELLPSLSFRRAAQHRRPTKWLAFPPPLGIHRPPMALAFGLDVAFDTASGDFTKYNARVSHTNQDLTASLMLNKKGNTLAASHYHHVQLTTSVGAEIAHNFSSNENTITVGTQHELDPLTTLKGRYNNFGIVSALIQHAWRPMSLITFSTEVDTKAIEKSPKFGLALSPKP
ncbi:Mitochondrial outer membrane porin [Hordeum vulgare]|nr:Mitochondrial outer membrane porin [Hordeum vulgare]